MRTYILGSFAIFCALLYFLTGCASHKPLAAHGVPVVVHQKQLPLPARPQTDSSRKAQWAANNAYADSLRAVNKLRALQRAAAKAQADSLRIVSHTPCPVTEIPKPRRRDHGCPAGCVRK